MLDNSTWEVSPEEVPGHKFHPTRGSHQAQACQGTSQPRIQALGGGGVLGGAELLRVLVLRALSVKEREGLCVPCLPALVTLFGGPGILLGGTEVEFLFRLERPAC